MTDRINRDLAQGRLHAVLGSEDGMRGGYEKMRGEKLGEKITCNASRSSAAKKPGEMGQQLGERGPEDL